MEEYFSHTDMFLFLAMSHRRFEKILWVGTLLSTKDRDEFRKDMVSALMNITF